MAAGKHPVHRHPAWFGVVMGTGALSLVAISQADAWGATWLEIAAGVALVLASAAALVLWPRYLSRLANREELTHELSDPAHGAMLATFPAGLLVLAVAWGRVGPEFIARDVAIGIDAFLLIVGAGVAAVLSAWWATSIGRSGVGLEGVNGGWLIPPVMNLIVPLAIVPIITAYPDTATWLIPLALAFWGIGAILFTALLALLVARLAFRSPVAAPMAPSMWIPLAPAGVLGLSLLRVLEAGVAVRLFDPAAIVLGVVVSAAGVGFGLWWALFAGIDLVRARREGVPFHPGWWGFVFPLAAMSLSMMAVAAVFDATIVAMAGTIVAVITAGVWALVAVRTVRIVVRKPQPAAT